MSMLANSAVLGDDGYTIPNSLRLRASASASLSRTFGTATSRKKFTLSFWVKRGILGGSTAIMANDTAPREVIGFIGNGGAAGDSLQFRDTTSGAYELTTNDAFRDPSAWYHCVVAFDTTQATASNRIRMYVNGVEQTSFATASYPGLNSDLYINSADLITIGRRTTIWYLDGYLAEMHFVDGQQLTPSDFGYFDPEVTNWWRPKKYTGTYGTNGFYLPFSNGTSLTTLGADASGNGNNWTLNNVSLTAGPTYDWMLDSPTNGVGGTQPVGNYAVLNPLDKSNSTIAISDGNLTATGYYSAGSNILFNSGKFFCEATALDVSTSLAVGVLPITATFNSGGGGPTGSVFYFSNDGSKQISGANTSYGATYGVNDVIGVAVDADAGAITFYKNGVSQGSISFSVNSSGIMFANRGGNAATKVAFNFGQRPFAYTPPTGFKALCTANLPTPTGAAANPRKYFDVVLWTGNNTNNRQITGLQFGPEFVWPKARGAAYDALITDIVRGAGKSLVPSSAGAEVTNNVNGYISAFNSDGITLTQGSSSIVSVNESGINYVAWVAKAGGTPVTNTAGSITSQVSANVAAGFSIVTWTGTGANATVGHGLGVAPKMVIYQARTGTRQNWTVGHMSLNGGVTPFNYFLKLNLTDAAGASPTPFNNTAPTSNVFSVGINVVNGVNYVAYCFAEVPGYSKIGSYTGNGSADGPFVYCGFRPKFVLIKRVDATGNWLLQDSARSPYNVSDTVLYPNASSAEQVSQGYLVDMLSNGFKLRAGAVEQNQNSGSYIYIAFAEAPFQYANAR